MYIHIIILQILIIYSYYRYS